MTTINYRDSFGNIESIKIDKLDKEAIAEFEMYRGGRNWDIISVQFSNK